MRYRSVFPAVLCAAAIAAEQPAIHGEYLEDRSNRVFGCYCEWSGEGETGGREAVLGWRIEEGRYEGADLAGLRMALVVRGDRTLSRPGAARQSVLFVDANASAAQQAAIEKLVRRNYGDIAGKLVGVERATLEFERTAHSAVLRMQGQGEVRMRKAVLPEDALQGAILWYEPFIPLKEHSLGTTYSAEYTGPGFDAKWRRWEHGVTGYFGRFALAPK